MISNSSRLLIHLFQRMRHQPVSLINFSVMISDSIDKLFASHSGNGREACDNLQNDCFLLFSKHILSFARKIFKKTSSLLTRAVLENANFQFRVISLTSLSTKQWSRIITFSFSCFVSFTTCFCTRTPFLPCSPCSVH